MKKNKTVLIILLSVFVLFMGVQMGLNYLINAKVTEVLKKTKPIITYELLDYSLLFNELQVTNINASNNAENSYRANVALLKLQGFSLMDFISKEQLHFGKLIIVNPVFRYVKEKDVKSSTKEVNMDGFSAILIDEFEVDHADLFFKQQSKSTSATISFLVKDIKLTAQTLKNKIPFEYGDSSFNIANFYTDLSELELLKFKELKTVNGTVAITDLIIQSKDSKKELSKKLTEEKEHLDLFFKRIELEDFGITEVNHQQKLAASNVKIIAPELKFFRDKRVADNTIYKPLYSEKLMRLKTLIDFPVIEIKEGLVVYEMLMDEGDEIGALVFNDVNAILKVSNLKGKEQLRLEAESMFMEKSPFALTIEFTDLAHNNFTSKGVLKDFKTDYINPFLYKILNTELKGEIDDLYFTISGNNTLATGDVKMKYDNLKLQINKYNLLKRTLHAVGNLVLKNTSSKEPEQFRKGTIKEERVQTKSLFNFLWISLRTGILDVVS